jgi:selenocysteine-specific elongation factor
MRQVSDVRAAIDRAGVQGLTLFAAGEAARASTSEVRAALAWLERDGHALHLGDLWFSRTLVDAMQARAVEHLTRAKTMTVIDFKAIAGMARNQAILLLEHFDRIGVTRRQGDGRTLVG